jgi:hypothetical protein
MGQRRNCRDSTGEVVPGRARSEQSHGEQFFDHPTGPIEKLITFNAV